jgi:hypothetical protein
MKEREWFSLTNRNSSSTAYGSMLGYKQKASDAVDWDIRAGC